MGTNFLAGFSFKTETEKDLAVEILGDHIRRFMKIWKNKQWDEIPGCWEKDVMRLRMLLDSRQISWKDFVKRQSPLTNPEVSRLSKTLKEFVCWRYLDVRYSILHGLVEKEEPEAMEKWDLVFTEDGHIRSKLIKQLRHEKASFWDEDLAFWILKNRDSISQWTLSELLEMIEKDRVIQGAEPRFAEGVERKQVAGKVRDLLSEMNLHVKE